MLIKDIINTIEYKLFNNIKNHKVDQLEIGSYDHPLKGIVVVYRVTNQLIEYCVNNDINLIITYEPLIIDQLSRIDVNTVKGKLIKSLLVHDISLYTVKENINIASDGINDWLAKTIQLTNTSILKNTHIANLKKIAVYTPISHADAIRNTMGRLGAGHIGNYSHCTFNISGVGTFMPLEGTNPFLGSVGAIEEASEIKIETIVNEQHVDQLINELKKVHPYEEMAYDIYTLAINGKAYGIGRIGQVQEVTFEEYVKHIANLFKKSYIKYIGDHKKLVNKVTVLNGDGSQFIEDCIKKNVDVLICRNFNDEYISEAMDNDICIIELGEIIDHIYINGIMNFLSKNNYSNIYTFSDNLYKNKICIINE